MYFNRCKSRHRTASSRLNGLKFNHGNVYSRTGELAGSTVNQILGPLGKQRCQERASRRSRNWTDPRRQSPRHRRSSKQDSPSWPFSHSPLQIPIPPTSSDENPSETSPFSSSLWPSGKKQKKREKWRRKQFRSSEAVDSKLLSIRR